MYLLNLLVAVTLSTISREFSLDQQVEIHNFLTANPSTGRLVIMFDDGVVNNQTLCDSSRNHRTPVRGNTRVDGQDDATYIGVDAWDLSGTICNSGSHFQLTITKTYINGFINFGTPEKQYIIKDGRLIEQPREEGGWADEDESFAAAEMQMYRMGQDSNVEVQQLAAGFLDVYVHVDIHDSLANRFPGNTIAAKRAEVAGYILALFCWINENLYFSNGFNLLVSGISHRTTSLSTTTSSSAYLRALRAEGRKSNAHLVYHATAERLGGGVAYLSGLYSRGSTGYGLCGSMSGRMNFWDRMCTAHEIGHNLGGPHTHDVAIDTCGNTCTRSRTTPTYLTEVKYGTIMSYCHLCQGGSTNVRDEFHPKMVTDYFHQRYANFQGSLNPIAPGTQAIQQCNNVQPPGPQSTTSTTTTTTTTTTTVLPESTRPNGGDGNVVYERIRTGQYISGDACGFRRLGENPPRYGACQQNHVRMRLCGGRTLCTASGITDVASCAATVAARTECSNSFDTWSDAIVSQYGFGRCSCLLAGKALAPASSVYVYIYQLKSTQATTTTAAVDPAVGYTKRSPGCVIQSNIRLIPNQSIQQCAAACNADANCVAFEYGVNHNGPSTLYSPTDCQLQNNANWRGCDGSRFNLDLYIKSNVPGSVALVDDQTTTKAPVLSPTCRVKDSSEFCQFPFVYRGNLYHGCIQENSSSEPWCATNQVGSQMTWDICDMNSGCQIENPSTTIRSEGFNVAQNTYVKHHNVANANWQFCSFEFSSKEWAEEQCNADPTCTYLHDADCDGQHFRYCSDINFSLVSTDTAACTYRKEAPEVLDCSDKLGELDCTQILATDKCNEYGDQCKKTCNRCTLRSESFVDSNHSASIAFAFSILVSLLLL
jgi:hypothetical protein